MTKEEFVNYLKPRIKSCNLNINIPVLGWRFDADNADYIDDAFDQIPENENIPILICQELEQTCKVVSGDKELDLSLIRICGFVLSENDDIELKNKTDLISAYEVGGDEHDNSEKYENLLFTDAQEFLISIAGKALQH